MTEKKLYIRSSEYDFMSDPIAIKSFKIFRKGLSQYMEAELDRPINLWFNNRLWIYSKVLLKPRYFMDSFKNLRKRSVVVNVASFDNQDSKKFRTKKLELIGTADLYYLD